MLSISQCQKLRPHVFNSHFVTSKMCVNFEGPVACKNRIRILLLGRDADIIVKTAAVQMEEDDNEIVTGQVFAVYSNLFNWIIERLILFHSSESATIFPLSWASRSSCFNVSVNTKHFFTWNGAFKHLLMASVCHELSVGPNLNSLALKMAEIWEFVPVSNFTKSSMTLRLKWRSG